MSKKILVASILIIGFAVAFSFSGDPVVYFNSTAVSTHTPVLIMGDNISRLDAEFYNDDSTYDMFISTWLPADLDALEAMGSFWIISPGKSFHDNYYIYKSSYYVTGSTDAITEKLHYMEKE